LVSASKGKLDWFEGFGAKSISMPFIFGGLLIGTYASRQVKKSMTRRL
jgi:hypothetical protein